MFLVGDASEWFLPMPVSLVVVGLVFAIWKRAAPRAKKLRRTTGLLVAVAFVALSTPAVINLGVQWLEGRPIPVTAQLDALGAPPAPLLRLSASERLALGYHEPDFGNVGDGGNVPGQVPLAAPHVVHGGHGDRRVMGRHPGHWPVLPGGQTGGVHGGVRPVRRVTPFLHLLAWPRRAMQRQDAPVSARGIGARPGTRGKRVRLMARLAVTARGRGMVSARNRAAAVPGARNRWQMPAPA